MSIGAIIFILGILYSIGQSIYEKSKKKSQVQQKSAELKQVKKVAQTIKNVEQVTVDRTVQRNNTSRNKKDISEKENNKIKRVLNDEHLSEQQKLHRLKEIKQGDLTESHQSDLHFDRQAIVNAVIMSEILAPPKVKR